MDTELAGLYVKGVFIGRLFTPQAARPLKCQNIIKYGKFKNMINAVLVITKMEKKRSIFFFFGVCIFYPVILLNSFNNSRSFCVNYLGFSMYTIMLSVNGENFISSFSIGMLFCYYLTIFSIS